MKITTLTVEDTSGSIATTVHHDEETALKALRLNYASGDLEETPDDELIQTLIDEYGLVIYIEQHDVPAPEPEPTTTRHTFLLAANVRAWHRFYVTELTPDQAMTLDWGGDEALALARQLGDAGRLEPGDIEYEDAPPIWDDAAQPDVIDFEEDS